MLPSGPCQRYRRSPRAPQPRRPGSCNQRGTSPCRNGPKSESAPAHGHHACASPTCCRVALHTTSNAGLRGGSANIHRGEVSLARHGVLFFDELPEFHHDVLEALREPIERGRVVVSRMTRLFMARLTPGHVEAWLAVFKAAGIRKATDADRLAWAAYQIGKMDRAQRRVHRAREDAPRGQWVRVSLLLRDGRLDGLG